MLLEEAQRIAYQQVCVESVEDVEVAKYHHPEFCL
jgi:hypothetical protein